MMQDTRYTIHDRKHVSCIPKRISAQGRSDMHLASQIMHHASGIGHRDKKGFTIIELVITMVLISIIAYIVATALSTGITAYFTTDNRKEALDQARIAMERITREIRNLRDSDDVATGTASIFSFTDVSGTAINFTYSSPNITRNGTTLSTNITSFSFSYIRADGTVEPTLVFIDTDPDNPATDTKRIRITFTATISGENVTLQSEVWPRSL